MVDGPVTGYVFSLVALLVPCLAWVGSRDVFVKLERLEVAEKTQKKETESLREELVTSQEKLNGIEKKAELFLKNIDGKFITKTKVLFDNGQKQKWVYVPLIPGMNREDFFDVLEDAAPDGFLLDKKFVVFHRNGVFQKMKLSAHDLKYSFVVTRS